MRPTRPLVLFAALAIFALVATGCGSDAEKNSSATKPAASVDPATRMKAALANSAKLKSGEVKIDAALSGGGFPGSLKITGAGVFDMEAKPKPAVDVNFSIDFGSQKLQLGFATVGGKGYVEFGDRAFELNKKQSRAASGMSIDPRQIQDLVNSLDVYVSDVKKAGTLEAGGETLDVYTAKLDVKRLVNDLAKKSGNKLLSVPGLGNTKDLASSVGETTVRIGIDANDLPRSLGIDATFGGGATGGGAAGGIKATLILTKVNEPVTIKKPANVTKGQDATQALGGLLGAAAGEQ
ncbi:MAG: hypothetical protein WAP37_01255 [Solirubrobacterales bacterium]